MCCEYSTVFLIATVPVLLYIHALSLIHDCACTYSLTAYYSQYPKFIGLTCTYGDTQSHTACQFLYTVMHIILRESVKIHHAWLVHAEYY